MELALRIAACLLALVLFLLLAFSITSRKLDEAEIGAAKIPPKELTGIAYFQTQALQEN